MKDPFKGFGPKGPPGLWLQAVFTDENRPDEYLPVYVRSQKKIKGKAIALLANQSIDYVILLRGQADTADIQQADILADFQREPRPGARRIQ